MARAYPFPPIQHRKEKRHFVLNLVENGLTMSSYSLPDYDRTWQRGCIGNGRGQRRRHMSNSHGSSQLVFLGWTSTHHLDAMLVAYAIHAVICKTCLSTARNAAFSCWGRNCSSGREESRAGKHGLWSKGGQHTGWFWCLPDEGASLPFLIDTMTLKDEKAMSYLW